MYLEHFKLTTLPFTLTPNTDFYCDLPGHQAALNVLLVSLNSGEGFIKIVGEVGSGKTLLCRKLLNSLDEDQYVTAFIPNPDLTPKGLRKLLAHELGIDIENYYDQNHILDLINEQLLEFNRQGKRAVLLLDEAQALSDECLEAVRLLTNLETESTKLLQVVLFGQPELDERLNKPSLRQLKQRICFSYNLQPIKRTELEDYIQHRLTKAGHTYGTLFTKKACNLLFKSSRGLPRVINILCHKALMVAYGRGQRKIDHKAMQLAIKDTEDVKLFDSKKASKGKLFIWGCALIATGAVATKYLALSGIIR